MPPDAVGAPGQSDRAATLSLHDRGADTLDAAPLMLARTGRRVC
jgi:hypothetical protein